MSYAGTIFDCYAPLIDKSHPLYSQDDETFKIPAFSKQMINYLFVEAQEYLITVPTLVNVNGPVVVIGDIHGNIRDLIRIVRENGIPKDFTYIFLGDYVDRGEFSIEVLTLLFAMQVVYQEKVVLLRGNHEVKLVGISYGFMEEVQDCYGDLMLFERAHEVFQNLSLVAVVNQNFFCVHGGISDRAMKLENISNLKKPIIVENLDQKDSEMVDDMLWSDPMDSDMDYMHSLRGHGHCYGAYAVLRFNKLTGLKKIIRGHSMAEKGVKQQICKSVITVFSTGYYRPNMKNSPGYVFIEEQNLCPFALHSMPQMQRKTTHFSRPVLCTNLSGLQSGRRIGPDSVNRYWSSRRPSCPPAKVGAESLPQIPALGIGKVKVPRLLININGRKMVKSNSSRSKLPKLTLSTPNLHQEA